MPVETIDPQELLRFLRQRSLFQKFKDEDLEKVAARLQEVPCAQAAHVFEEGQPGDAFYIIWTGQIRIWRREGEQELELAILERGDKFGEEAPLFERPRSATATALRPDTVLLKLHKTDLEWLIRTFPDTKEDLAAIAQAHMMARKAKFDWLQAGEVIYLVSRRHWMELAVDMWKPAVVLSFAAIALLGVRIPGISLVAALISGVAGGIGLLWLIWEGIDWQNDFFIITNQRVVWLERVLLQSDSRREAPLSAVQSVNFERPFWGRVFDYGQVTVRTFTGTGSLVLQNVRHPAIFQGHIEELLLRVRSKTEESRSEAMRFSIRRSLGLTKEDESYTPAIQPIEIDSNARRPFGIARTREVEGSTITYHKHPWVLLMKIWLPGFLYLGVLGGVVFFMWRDFTTPTPVYPSIGSALLLGLPLSLIPLGWVVYNYLDWRNDLYRITKDSIIDSEKKPLGQEITKTAPIRNIQSITHSRLGLLRLILNFGDVSVVVADTTLTFREVHDPATVQQDIFYRQEQLKFEAQEKDNEQERVRISEWFRIYHDVLSDERAAEADEPEAD